MTEEEKDVTLDDFLSHMGRYKIISTDGRKVLKDSDYNADFAFDWNPDEDDFTMVKIYKDIELKPSLGNEELPPLTYLADICEEFKYNVCPDELTDDDGKKLVEGCYRWRGNIIWSTSHTMDGIEYDEEWAPESVYRIGPRVEVDEEWNANQDHAEREDSIQDQQNP